MYGLSISPHPGAETRKYVYLTWPDELARIYDERAMIEIDPRIQTLLESVVPLVWDQATFRGRSPQVDRFLDFFQSYGISSGIACPIRDMRGRAAILSLGSEREINDEVHRNTNTQNSGEVMLFGLYFHELFVRGVVDDIVPQHLRGSRLSSRERDCLAMASRGLAGEDIAAKLSLSIRTVQNHFDSIRSKLGAANRQEAVALALETGIITRASGRCYPVAPRARMGIDDPQEEA